MVSTDDAYVGADTAVIAPKVAGYVKSVPVIDNSRVTAGTPLLLIDDSDYRIALQQAEAQVAAQQAAIARIDQQIAAGSAQVAQAQAELASAKAGAANAKLEYDRAVALAGKSVGTQQAVDVCEGGAAAGEREGRCGECRRDDGGGERRGAFAQKVEARARSRPGQARRRQGAGSTSTTRSCARLSTASSATAPRSPANTFSPARG